MSESGYSHKEHSQMLNDILKPLVNDDHPAFYCALHTYVLTFSHIRLTKIQTAFDYCLMNYDEIKSIEHFSRCTKIIDDSLFYMLVMKKKTDLALHLIKQNYCFNSDNFETYFNQLVTEKPSYERDNYKFEHHYQVLEQIKNYQDKFNLKQRLDKNLTMHEHYYSKHSMPEHFHQEAELFNNNNNINDNIDDEDDQGSQGHVGKTRQVDKI